MQPHDDLEHQMQHHVQRLSAALLTSSGMSCRVRRSQMPHVARQLTSMKPASSRMACSTAIGAFDGALTHVSRTWIAQAPLLALVRATFDVCVVAARRPNPAGHCGLLRGRFCWHWRGDRQCCGLQHHLSASRKDVISRSCIVSRFMDAAVQWALHLPPVRVPQGARVASYKSLYFPSRQQQKIQQGASQEYKQNDSRRPALKLANDHVCLLISGYICQQLLIMTAAAHRLDTAELTLVHAGADHPVGLQFAADPMPSRVAANRWAMPRWPHVRTTSFTMCKIWRYVPFTAG